MTRGKGRKTRASGTFGTVQKLPSGRYRAMYYGPDGRRYKAPKPFLTKKEARAWLALRQTEIVTNSWLPPGTVQPATPKITLADYSDTWLAQRDLKDRTREHYRKLLDQHILQPLGALPVGAITADDVKDWHAAMDKDTPTIRAHAYGLLRTIMGSAVTDGKATVNPCVIRGAGSTKRVHTIKPVTLDELETLTNEMPEQYRAMILLACWCALRFGELTELRRKDIDLADGVIRIRRAVVRVDDGFKVTTPKSDAGIRDVAVPPHLIPAIEQHLAKHVDPKLDSLLFPAQHGGHLAPATLYRQFYKARAVANRKDLRFHDLRHSGAVLAAATGATLAELMGRLGHSTPAAALRYQHVAQGRDKQIAAALSARAAASSTQTTHE